MQANPTGDWSLPKYLPRGYALPLLFSDYELTWAKGGKPTSVYYRSPKCKGRAFLSPSHHPLWSQGLQSPWIAQHWQAKGRGNVWTVDFWVALGICQFLPLSCRVCSSLETLGMKESMMLRSLKDFVSSEGLYYQSYFITQKSETF